jgi:gluconolactonase
VDVQSGEAELLTSVNWFPNGIGFDGDENLWVASSADRRVVRFGLVAGRLVDPEPVIEVKSGHPDGFAFDTEGNLILPLDPEGPEKPGEVQVWSTSGQLLETFRPDIGIRLTNVALGSEHLLVITSSGDQSVIGIDNWPTTGMPLHPFRI